MKEINKVIVGIAVGAIATASVTIPYKSVRVTEEAKEKIDKYSEGWGMTIQDTASKMILTYDGMYKILSDCMGENTTGKLITNISGRMETNSCNYIPTFTGSIRPTNYDELSSEEKIRILEEENRNNLEWIDKVNN